jgi:DNA-binding NarL/FixJ family response regulator
MPSHEVDSDFVSIVVADGTRIHTHLLADALRADVGLHVVAAASNSEELLAAVTRVPIDVAVISRCLDDQPGRGTQVLREMRALRPQIKGVILLDSSKPEDVLECFRAGARGIFSKQERLESLSKCIRSVHEGQVWARSVDLDHALEALANSPLVAATDHKGIELLSAREREVIQHLAGGMTNREIADALGLSSHTVKNYLFRIFDKLGVSNRTELLYLTMNNAQALPKIDASDRTPPLSSIIEAAEGGDPRSQLRLAEHFCQMKDGPLEDGRTAGAPPDTISACMWYLLAEKASLLMVEQIEEGKKNIRLIMSPQELEEAENRTAAWLRNAKKNSGFALGGEERTNPRNTNPRKMSISART